MNKQAKKGKRAAAQRDQHQPLIPCEAQQSPGDWLLQPAIRMPSVPLQARSVAILPAEEPAPPWASFSVPAKCKTASRQRMPKIGSSAFEAC